jgi:hypothetical protein
VCRAASPVSSAISPLRSLFVMIGSQNDRVASARACTSPVHVARDAYDAVGEFAEPASLLWGQSWNASVSYVRRKRRHDHQGETERVPQAKKS